MNSIKEQTGLDSSNIISVIKIVPKHPAGGGGFNYILSNWRAGAGIGLQISILCNNNGNPSDQPVQFFITLKMLNKLI